MLARGIVSQSQHDGMICSRLQNKSYWNTNMISRFPAGSFLANPFYLLLRQDLWENSHIIHESEQSLAVGAQEGRSQASGNTVVIET